jgi:hypothetical protein
MRTYGYILNVSMIQYKVTFLDGLTGIGVHSPFHWTGIKDKGPEYYFRYAVDKALA